jgi:hypothetical protein
LRASIASSTFARVVGRTFVCPFRTRETVATPTPARVATSAIVEWGSGNGSIPATNFLYLVLVVK